LAINSGVALADDSDNEICTIIGTELDDFLVGTDGNDVICGLGGNDIIIGGAGDDEILGGNGNDIIDGGEGFDLLIGGDGDDYIEGGPGADKLFGGNGSDALIGGLGDDVLIGGDSSDSLNGGDGVDYCDRDKSDSSISSCFFDRSGPKLASVAISTKTIDTSSQSAVLVIRARVIDKGAGVKDGDFRFMPKNDLNSNWNMSFAFTGRACTGTPDPNPDSSYSVLSSCRVSGDEFDGIYESKIVIARYTPRRTYSLVGVTLRDNAGNQSEISNKTLNARRLAVSFSQVGVGDSSKPKVIAVQMLTKSVNTNSQSAIVNFRIRVRDTGSGIEALSGSFGSKTSSVRFDTGIGNGYNLLCNNIGAPDPTAGQIASSCLESGTEFDATFNVKIRLPQYSPKATYRLSDMWIRDKVQNTAWISNKKPWNKIAFKQLGAGDSKPPKISEVNVITPIINTSSSEQLTTIRVKVSDNMSGVEKLELLFAPKARTNFMWFTFDANSQRCNATRDAALPGGACLISGSLNDGVIELKSSLPAHARSGSYFLQQVSITDRARSVGASCIQASCHEREIKDDFTNKKIQIRNLNE
jgi:hypothetical protein